jgi:hypothetical protein
VSWLVPFPGDRGRLHSLTMCLVPWQFRHLSGWCHVVIQWAKDKHLKHLFFSTSGIFFRRSWRPSRAWPRGAAVRPPPSPCLL